MVLTQNAKGSLLLAITTNAILNMSDTALKIEEISLIYLSATAIVESVIFPLVRSFFISDSLLSMSISSPRAGSEVAVISINFDKSFYD